MPKRSFTLPGINDGEPVEFELVYKRTDPDTGQVTEQVEPFVCLPDLPATASRFLLVEKSALACIGFVERCIASDADAARFMELCAARDVMIRREELADVLDWLVETYSERPTVRPGS